MVQQTKKWKNITRILDRFGDSDLIKVCPVCGLRFIPYYPKNRIYCSPECAKEAERRRARNYREKRRGNGDGKAGRAAEKGS